MAKIHIIATVPDALVQAWFQHVRDFDASHEGCHFDVAADAPNMTVREMVDAMAVKPHLTFTDIILLDKGREPVAAAGWLVICRMLDRKEPIGVLQFTALDNAIQTAIEHHQSGCIVELYETRKVDVPAVSG